MKREQKKKTIQKKEKRKKRMKRKKRKKRKENLNRVGSEWEGAMREGREESDVELHVEPVPS